MNRFISILFVGIIIVISNTGNQQTTKVQAETKSKNIKGLLKIEQAIPVSHALDRMYVLKAEDPKTEIEVIRWQDNPNKCDQDKEWISAEAPYNCIIKPIVNNVNRSVTHVEGCGAYKDIIASYDWNLDVALNVCNVESSGNIYASNWNDGHGSCIGSFGLFQIACIHQSKEASYDPVQNVAKAYELYQRSGWAPWSFMTCKKIACY